MNITAFSIIIYYLELYVIQMFKCFVSLCVIFYTWTKIYSFNKTLKPLPAHCYNKSMAWWIILYLHDLFLRLDMFQINQFNNLSGSVSKVYFSFLLEKFATICFGRIRFKCRCSCFNQVLGSHCLQACPSLSRTSCREVSS